MKHLLTKTGLFDSRKFGVEYDNVYFSDKNNEFTDQQSMGLEEFIDLIQINAYNVGKLSGLKTVKSNVPDDSSSDNDMWSNGHEYATDEIICMIDKYIEHIEEIIAQKMDEYSDE